MSRVKVLLLSLLAVFAVGAIASGSASALVWEECLNEHLGTGTKYTTSSCTTISATGTWEWMPITEELQVTSEGGVQELILNTSPNIIITCQKLLDKGNIKPGGLDLTESLLYHECKINITPCPIVKTKGQPNGLIEVGPLKSKLITLETEGKLLVENEFTPDERTNFVVLEIGKEENAKGEAKGICGALGTTKPEVTGTVVAMPEGEVLNFEGKGTLKTAGIESKYVGKDTQKLVNGHAFRAGS
jgi:hypothetical protein